MQVRSFCYNLEIKNIFANVWLILKALFTESSELSKIKNIEFYEEKLRKKQSKKKGLMVTKEELKNSLRESYLGLRNVVMNKVGCCGIGFINNDGPPRDIINIEEIIYYIYYKDRNLPNNILNYLNIWVIEKNNEGYRAITFNRKSAREDNALIYFYDLFDDEKRLLEKH